MKYPRHKWKMSEITFISSHLSNYSDEQLAKKYTVSTNSLVKARIRYGVLRQPLGKAYAINRIPRWKYSRTDPAQLSLSFQPTAQSVLYKAYELLNRNCIECARLLINEQTTEVIFSEIMHIATSRHQRGCWQAIANYVFRAIENVPNDTYMSDLKKRKSTAKRKCSFC